MASLIYSLCALLCLGIAVMLWRHYRAFRSRLVLWSALCFSGLTINNLILVLDKLVWVDSDLSLVRHCVALLSLTLLAFGLTYEDE